MGVDAEMYAEIDETITPEQILEVSRRLVDCFGTGTLWLRDEFADYLMGIPAKGQTKPHALIPVTESDYLTAAPGKRLVMVMLGCRYYGKGYERGPFHDIAAIARFLRSTWPTGRVFYGGDSGDTLEEWTDEFERDLWDHFVKNGHRPYRAYFSDNEIRPPTCDRCLVPMLRTGFGGDFAAWHCLSCNRAAETHDGGKTLVPPKEHASNRLQIDLDPLVGRTVILADGPRVYLNDGQAFEVRTTGLERCPELSKAAHDAALEGSERLAYRLAGAHDA